MISSLSVIALVAGLGLSSSPILESSPSVFSATVSDVQVLKNGRACVLVSGRVTARTEESAADVFATEAGRPMLACAGLGGSLPTREAGTLQVVSVGSSDVDEPLLVELSLDELSIITSRPLIRAVIEFPIRPGLRPGSCTSVQRDWRDPDGSAAARVTVDFCATT